MPAKPQPKKNFQIRRMFGLAGVPARSSSMDVHEFLGELAGIVTRGRTSSLKEITFDEANEMIVSLGGTAMSLVKGRSKRTENHRKQQAGIKTIETADHIGFIRDQAALRNMSEEGIASMAARMNLPWPTQTTEQGNKLAEALKAMNKRDGLLAFNSQFDIRNSKLARSSQPSYRRVA